MTTQETMLNCHWKCLSKSKHARYNNANIHINFVIQIQSMSISETLVLVWRRLYQGQALCYHRSLSHW